MSLKSILLALLVIVSVNARAQDKIYKTDGKIINAKVKAVSDAAITYKRSDNLDGPDYTILKTEVTQIKYENGTIDKFEVADDRESRRPGPRGRSHFRGRDRDEDSHGPYVKNGAKKKRYVRKYGVNLLSVTGGYAISIDGTLNDAGIGMCYERLLGKKGRLSFNLPVMVCFSSSKDFTGNVYNNSSGPNTAYGTYNSYYFMPGIKFYPAPDNDKVRYALGASLFAVFGTEPYAVYQDNTMAGVYPPGNWSYAMYGLMISNSVNVTFTKHLYAAFDLGLGIPVSDNRHHDSVVFISPFIQVGAKFGLRF